MRSPITFWLQRPNIHCGWQFWEEIHASNPPGGRKAVTIFIICLGVTLYYRPGKEKTR
ncbi:hypothetical protein ES703_14181 [subsurface metagenome]